ncbi:MAG: hypothetical protein AABY93_11415 [Bacteroidota bacterium]
MTIQASFKRFSLALFLLVLSCIEPYDPYVDQETPNMLVVDGFVNATDHSATVRLSRTQPISDLALGGLFPPTPISVLGNIHSISDKNELVLGYFSGAEIKDTG